MLEIEINKENLEKFLLNIRNSDKEELIYFLGENYKEKFVKTVLENKKYTYFLSYNSIPSCIGGIYKDKYGAQVWLLCAEKYDKKYLFRYIKEKINIFKRDNSYLYNYIYRTNFNAIRMLSRLGFEVIDLKTPVIKKFYYERRLP